MFSSPIWAIRRRVGNSSSTFPPPVSSVSIGFIGSFSGSNFSPTAFSVNGIACTGNATTTAPTTTPTTTPSGGAAPALHVNGNKLVTAAGATYRLLGVNRSSAEFACVQGRASSTRRSLTRPRSTP